MADYMKPERGNLETLYERMKEFDTAMFITVGDDGMIHSRPMMTQEREPDADLWFVTSRDSLKAEELLRRPNVGVTYYRDSDNAYIALSGVAKLTEDRALIASKWKDSWRAWFPDGPDSPDIALIKVDVKEAEYWAPKGGKLSVMFEYARGVLTGHHPEIDPPEHLDMGTRTPAQGT